MLDNFPVDQLLVKSHSLWADQWLLLTCGDFAAGDYNAMTVAWGSLGVIWEKPFAMVPVRPDRYTFQFMERYETFTLCAFAEKYRDALQLLGTRSGRDGNKIAEAGLTPVKSRQVAAPGYAEAELVLECKKMYWNDLNPDHFLDPKIATKYPRKDYHRVYFGEVLAVSGSEQYRSRE